MSRIFISYRRNGGEYLAGRIYDYLVAKGISVFYDVESLEAGKFNEQLYERIEECEHFILILPPNALDRCTEPMDWVRLEISKALELNKNIIPLMMPGFEFPDSLPEDIKEIANYQGITINNTVFKDQMIKLMFMIGENPYTEKGEKDKAKEKNTALLKIIAILMVILAIVGGCVIYGFFALTDMNKKDKETPAEQPEQESVSTPVPPAVDEVDETEKPEVSEEPEETEEPEQTVKPVPSKKPVLTVRPTKTPDKTNKPEKSTANAMPSMKQLKPGLR